MTNIYTIKTISSQITNVNDFCLRFIMAFTVEEKREKYMENSMGGHCMKAVKDLH